MHFRQLLNETACASHVLGCRGHSAFAVVDPHVDLVDDYMSLAGSQGARIVAVLDTHVQADHVSGLPELVARTGATAYLPENAGVAFEHQPLADEPWFVLTGDALLIGDAGRPDLHAHGEHTVEQMARTLYRSLTERLLTLPDHVVLYPSHYAGSVCGRCLSADPISTIGFERRHNPALRFESEDAFVAALTTDIPTAPEGQAAIVAANRAGRPVAEVA